MAFLRSAADLKVAGGAAHDIHLYWCPFWRNDGGIVRIAPQDIQTAAF